MIPSEYLRPDIYVKIFKNDPERNDHPHRPVRTLYNILLGINLSLFMLVGFYSIILAYKRLLRPGVSIEMRKLFLKKHALYVLALIVIWIFCLLYNYYDLFDPFNALYSLNIPEIHDHIREVPPV